MSLNFSSLELKNKTIVIVEDDVPSLRYYETLLQSSGADVIKFRTGKDFVDFVNKTILDMEKSGEAKKLFDKWFGPNSKAPMQRGNFKITADK